MSKYAEKTDVSSDRSRVEIETILRRYGADQYLSGWSENKAQIGFRMNGKMIRFILPLPDPHDPQFTKTDTGRDRSERQARLAYEQAIRQRWRSLALNIKAKLAAVEDGISTFESEFMSKIVMPNGMTLEDIALPMVEQAYLTGKMPDLLPHLSEMRT